MSDYGGYKNFETWKLALWLHSDDGIKWESSDVDGLAEEISDLLYGMADSLPGNYFHDVITTELNQIDFKEIARTILGIEDEN